MARHSCFWILCFLLVSFHYPIVVHAHANISRHLLLEDTSMVVLLSDTQQTPGPFAEEDDDYVRVTNDLTQAGVAGSPGLTEDRATVTEGVPLTITISVYDVATPSVGVELPNVEVFLWHTDAKGVYSAVDDERNGEITAGQVWCRGIQLTNQQGQATFKTVLPGWYPGRAVHYHLRLRYPGATNFAATSQLYINDDDLAQYRTVEPYSFNPAPITPLYNDGIFVRLGNPTIQQLLTLKMEGSVDTGYSASVSVGLVAPPGMVGVGTNEPTVAPTEAPTDDPTTALITTAPMPTPDPTAAPTKLVPVVRPTFAFEEAPPTTIPPSAEPTTTPREETASEGGLSEEAIAGLEDLTTTDSNAALSGSCPQFNGLSIAFAGFVSILTALVGLMESR